MALPLPSLGLRCGMVSLVISVVLILLTVPQVRGLRLQPHQVNMTVETGRDATLTCTVRGIGRRRVVWRKLPHLSPLTVGTSRFISGGKYRARRQGEDWQLVIKRVRHEDAGEYECRVSGKDDMANVFSLNVPGPGRTYLLPTKTTVTAGLGSTAILPCHVQGLRKNLVLWHDESGMVISLRKKVYSGDKRHKLLHTTRPQWSLQIRNVKDADFGTYTCVINTDPLLTRSVSLVKGSATGSGGDKVPETGQSQSGSPQLVKETFRSDVQVDQFQSATLVCQFKGSPPPTVKWERRIWSRDGVKIVEDLKTEGETYTLTNAQPEDTGVYVCKANNRVPPPEQAKIRVKVTAVPTTTTPITTFDPLLDAPPRTYAMEAVVYQTLGRDAEVACKAVGVPRPDVVWERDGRRITDDYKHGITSHDYRHHTKMSTLLVRSVHPGNFGSYVCRASNSFGEATTSIELAELGNP